VDGILRLTRSDLAGPVNIGNPDEMSVLDLAKRIIELTGSSSPVEFVDRPVDDPGVRRPDTTLARTELGWEPQVTWQEGLARTADWFNRELAAA
jgi:dTDP-glucose 4,6-dehydratase